MSRTELSVVVPVFGCRSCLPSLYARLRAAAEQVSHAVELVFVDDGSPDGAWATLREFAERDRRVVALRLSRNFGQDAAITAGLSRARGRWCAVIDCDLEEPPEAIPTLYAKAQEGFDVVRGVRSGRRRRGLRGLAGRLWLRLLLEGESRPDYGTLSILSRPVVDEFLRVGDRDREYRLVLDWLGFSSAAVSFASEPRPSGRSSYTLRRLLQVAAAGTFFRTTALLRVIVCLGLLVAAAGAGLAAYVVVSFFTVGAPAGYTSLAVLLLVLSGFVIVSIGVVGLYVGRIFEQVKGRPLFIVETELRGESFAPAPEPSPERSR